MSTELIGWVATAVFISSYMLDAKKLRYAQAFGAGLWLIYGLLMHAMPVVVCNILVLTVALASTFKKTETTTPSITDKSIADA